jgi:hypothetical protein
VFPGKHAENPWKLMTWIGHKRIDEAMLYVNFAGNHLRQLPPEIHFDFTPCWCGRPALCVGYGNEKLIVRGEG